MKTLTLELSVYELKTVLQALGNMPYIQIQELIGNLQLQAIPQLEALQKAQEAAETPSEKATKKTEKAA